MDSDTKSWFWGVIVFIITVILISAVALVTHIFSAPARVVSKTLETNNIISSYEWFYDVNAQFTSRLGQIKDQKSTVGATTDPKELARLRMELSAMRQSCRDLATKYNANSEKANTSIFKSHNLPSTLSMSDCEN